MTTGAAMAATGTDLLDDSRGADVEVSIAEGAAREDDGAVMIEACDESVLLL